MSRLVSNFVKRLVLFTVPGHSIAIATLVCLSLLYPMLLGGFHHSNKYYVGWKLYILQPYRINGDSKRRAQHINIIPPMMIYSMISIYVTFYRAHNTGICNNSANKCLNSGLKKWQAKILKEKSESVLGY